jgi:hypothetical protein
MVLGNILPSTTNTNYPQCKPLTALRIFLYNKMLDKRVHFKTAMLKILFIPNVYIK